MKNVISLLKDPSGERISVIKIVGIGIFLFLITFVPISIYIHYAQQNHEKQKEENSSKLVGGDAPDAEGNADLATRLKNKSGDAVDKLSEGKQNQNPILGDNPLNNDNNGQLNSKNQVPGMNGQSSSLNNTSANTQEQRPPINGSNNDPIAQEYSTQKVDKVKRTYDGINAGISLSTPNKSSSQVENSGGTGTNNSIAPSNQSTPDNQQQNSGIGLGGGFNAIAPKLTTSGNQSVNSQAQEDKNTFLENSAGGNASSTSNSNKVQPLISKYSLLAGDFIPAIMISGINTDTSSQVIAQTSVNMYDTVHGQFLLIPKGSRLIGIYSSKISYLQKRIPVAWKRVIFPDGKSYLLEGLPGTDLAGNGGFYNAEGIDNHFWAIYGSGFVMSVITGGITAAQNSVAAGSTSGSNSGSGAPSTSQTMTNSVGQQLSQQIGQSGSNIQTQPTLTIPPGYEFNIMLTVDLSLVPYSKEYK